MNNLPLFRKEAISSHQTQWLGNIVLIRPVSFTTLTLFSLLIATTLIIFAIFGTYTKRSSVIGQLIPDTGLIKIYTSQPAVISQKSVKEGQQVQRGDTLFVLSVERHSTSQTEVQATISEQVEQRQRSFKSEREKTQQIQIEERTALQNKIAAFQQELEKIDNSIDNQRTRVNLADDTVVRYEGLLKQDFVSREQAQQKEEELLDQQTRLQSLERDLITTNRELQNLRADLTNLNLKQQNQLAQIDRNITSSNQELAESEAKRHIVITAPESGIVTAITAELGQSVDTSHPLASIVSEDATMQAQLYAPSKTIGFVKQGDLVLLRYQAYPYQKFGHAKGIVKEVSRTALLESELNSELSSSSNVANEPLYRITVDLNSQTINAYGKPQKLQAGMLLNADIEHDTRHLYEWVLEPLYSLTGNL